MSNASGHQKGFPPQNHEKKDKEARESILKIMLPTTQKDARN